MILTDNKEGGTAFIMFENRDELSSLNQGVRARRIFDVSVRSESQVVALPGMLIIPATVPCPGPSLGFSEVRKVSLFASIESP